MADATQRPAFPAMPPEHALPDGLESISLHSAVCHLAALLAAEGLAQPRDEARDLIAALLDVPRFWPTAHRDAELDGDCWRAACRAARRRAAGAPFAYAVGRAAFRHLTLDVDERVLIPRQETEQLVDLVLTSSGQGGTVVDIGTGSGAIALALATEGHFDRVIATDVSRDALAVASANAAHLSGAARCAVELRHGSLLAPVSDVRARVLVSNPPYIAFSESAELPGSVRDWEPAVALYSAREGMAATAAIVRGAAQLLEPGGLLALEVDARRASLGAELAAADGRYERIEIRLDLSGRERFLLARRAR